MKTGHDRMPDRADNISGRFLGRRKTSSTFASPTRIAMVLQVMQRAADEYLDDRQKRSVRYFYRTLEHCLYSVGAVGCIPSESTFRREVGRAIMRRVAQIELGATSMVPTEQRKASFQDTTRCHCRWFNCGPEAITGNVAGVGRRHRYGRRCTPVGQEGIGAGSGEVEPSIWEIPGHGQ